MIKCPICQTETKKEYCPTCAWEFEYYFDELDLESKAIYEDRLKIWSGLYSRLNDFEKGMIASKVIPKQLPFKPEMVLIKGGSFMMGSDEYENTKPIHQVTIDYDFEIGKYSVTFEEYDWYCNDTGIYKPSDSGFGRGRRPVINVSWNDVQFYIEWLNKKTGESYRLPTESEWEFVAKANEENQKKLENFAWYKHNSDNKTHEVGTKKSYGIGVYDLHGNVWEWCQDVYSDTYQNRAIDGSSHKEEGGTFFKKEDKKVLRGGSWYHDLSRSCSGNRTGENKTVQTNRIGFRLQRTLP